MTPKNGQPRTFPLTLYRRYAITDAAMLREGVAKLTAFAENAKTATRKVVPITEAKKAKASR